MKSNSSSSELICNASGKKNNEYLSLVLNHSETVDDFTAHLKAVLSCSKTISSAPVVAQEGMKSCHLRRRQLSLTDSRDAHSDEYQNLTKGLEIYKPFQVLSSDIRYNRTGEGFDYLCQIREVYTNVVLASCQQKRMKKELVLHTLNAAKSR